MKAEDLAACAGFALTEDTLERLHTFAALVEKWNPRINLVSRNTLPELWTRHISDSLQLYRHAPPDAGLWADFGSGGGFPGIVLAILSRQVAPEVQHVLVESDQRKSAFLREAIRSTGIQARVLASRIEAIEPLGAKVVTARALAPLPELFCLIHPHLAADGVAILPKGSSASEEVSLARVDWDFDVEAFGSTTEANARILRVTALIPRVEGTITP